MYSPPNNMTTPTLTGIPIELRLEIAEHLKDSPAALSALCRTKAHFYNTLTQSRRKLHKYLLAVVGCCGLAVVSRMK
jgi:hypothetical protein